MEIAIRKEPNGFFYIDKTALTRFSKEELSLPPYNFTFVNVDAIYADCEGFDFNEDFTFNVEKYNARKQSYLYEEQLNELETWFKWYDNQVAQYNRCQRLGIEFDKDINELDNQAKVNQERIAELRIALSITI